MPFTWMKIAVIPLEFSISALKKQVSGPNWGATKTKIILMIEGLHVVLDEGSGDLDKRP